MIRLGLVITFIGFLLVGYASKKVGGFDNYMKWKMMHGRRRGSGWFAQILNLGLLITVLGIIIKFLN
jgi:hypothetical protein